jgi:hypothetical protein
MVCERCGAPCEDGALICFECGAPIGEDPARSGLHKLPEHLQAPVTIELPAIRAPATATTSGAPGGGDAEESARSTTVCPRCGAPLEPNASICFECGLAIGPGSPRTGPLSIPDYLKAPITIELPVVIATGQTKAAQAPKRRERRPPTRRELIAAGSILGVAALVVLAGVVVLLYRILPPPVPVQAIYHDPRRHFSFAQPALWQATPLGDGVRLTDATGISSLEITAQPALNLDASGYADLLAQPYHLASLLPVQVGGANWEQRAGATRGDDGVLRERVILATIYDGTLYAIQFTCPASVFPDLDAQVYQPVLASFHFAR